MTGEPPTPTDPPTSSDPPSPAGPITPDPARALSRGAYESLRGLAAAYLSRERADHTLQPTALVHEAFAKLAGGGAGFKSETHFQAVAANAMRQILVDHARARAAHKRGGDRVRVTFSGAEPADRGPDVELLALHEALEDLARLDPRRARIVELRFFGGLSCAEAADEVGVSPKTAEADWYFARAWLRDRLREEGA